MDLTTRPRQGRASLPSRLLVTNFVACLLLLVQYLLGMAVNLYAVLPTHHPGANASNYIGGVASGLGWVIPNGPGWAAAHAAFGLALVVAAFASIAFARGQSSRVYLITSVLGALIPAPRSTALVSSTTGMTSASMIMAGLWAAAQACYLTGLFYAARSCLRLAA